MTARVGADLTDGAIEVGGFGGGGEDVGEEEVAYAALFRYQYSFIECREFGRAYSS